MLSLVLVSVLCYRMLKMLLLITTLGYVSMANLEQLAQTVFRNCLHWGLLLKYTNTWFSTCRTK
jgi:hypothetical protein